MPVAATFIGNTPTIQPLKFVRGDGGSNATFTVTHTFGEAANVAEVRFFVRTEPDGDLVVGLTLTDNASQINLTVDNKCTITLLPDDTDGKIAGNHWYDVEIEHDDGRVITFQIGGFELIPDIASDYGGSVLPGPQSVSEQLIQWTLTEAWAGTFTRDGNDTVTSAAVVWPDGSAGTFTTVTINATFLAIDAFTVSHTNSGLTVTQAAVTRNSNGAVTVRPIPTVA